MKARHKDTGEIIDLAEEGIITHDGRRFCWYQVELIPEPIDECTPSLPSNVDVVAEDYAGVNYDCETETDAFYRRIEIEAFKAGAEWMARQGVTLNLSIDEFSCDAFNACVEQGLTSEDDVIVQIRKK